MRIFVKNKIISLRGNSFAVDEAGNSIFKINGKLFTLTRKKQVKDLNGNLLYTVRTRVFNFFFHKAYIIDNKGNKVASVRNRFALRNNFKLEALNGSQLTIDGDFLSFNMTVYRSGEAIGRIHRNFTIIRDSFILDAEPEYLAFMTALIIAIDNVTDDASDSHS